MHSITRIDLSTVLENMVKNNVDGREIGLSFANKMAFILGGNTGLCTRIDSDAFDYIFELIKLPQSLQNTVQKSLEKNTITEQSRSIPKAVLLVPVTLPYVLVCSLQRLHCILNFYDPTDDGMTPDIKEEDLKNLQARYKDIPLCIALFYPYCISKNHILTLPSFLAEIPKIVIGNTLPYSGNEDKSHVQKKDKKESSDKHTQSEYPAVSSSQTENMFSSSDADFTVFSMEKNNIITSACGAVLSIQHKKYIKKTKSLENSYYFLSDFNAALAHSQLRQLSSFQKNCTLIKEYFIETADKHAKKLPDIVREDDAILQSFPFIVKTGNKNILQFFEKHKVEARRFFEDSYLQHKIDARPKEAYAISYPNANKLLSQVLHIPLYPSLAKDEITHIAKLLASHP